MTTKKKAAPKSGATSPAKKPAKPAPPSSTESASDDSQSASPESISSDTPATPPSPSPSTESPAPENPGEALHVLDQAAEALRAEPVASAAPVPPSGGASDAEAQLSAAVAMNAEPASQPGPRKGGWPKGRPRKPHSDSSAFPQRPASGPVGPSADSLTTAQLRQRVAELEAQNSESVKLAMTAGFAQIARIGFGIVARRNGVHWYLSAEEAAEIGSACGNAALPYVSYIAPALPFIAAVGAIYGSVSSRMEIDLEIEQGKRARVLPGEDSK